ncbi:glycoside hydrolase 28 protein [Venturia inaequalis]|uniref:endo-polygalacturonase n=1 Tax=Venturia inaequalis TaxID=5025 RepID=A0A8H3U1I4_VENIN|nr:glycoside hydrolase 28 protein [Venturia inaequalis]KAE9982917.1 hypothetical protein EG328_010464 [Venturia inaequalis]KAE9993598.1 hypothetical protein EG327_004357 [Venturia inaequalis]
MMNTFSAFAILAYVTAAAPSLRAVDSAIEERGSSSCTFTTAAAAISGKSSCTTITLSNIAVPAGTTLDLTGLTKGTSVIFSGTTTFGYKEWVGPLISIAGTGIKVTGAPGHLIDGDGSRWWDGKGGNSGKKKPKFFYAHKMFDSIITGLNIKNHAVQCFSVSGANNLVIDSVTTDNSAGDAGDLGHNTDAYDVGASTNIVISNANVKNQDDCLAINSGSNITFIGGTCSGGHGLSIGSVGGRSDNVVKDITIASSTIINSDNGVRIKTVSGATGSVSGVTYKDITLKNIGKYGIVIEQDYLNGGPTGKPTTGVPITGLTVTNVKGTVASSGTNIYLLCGKGSCSNWKFSNIAVTGGKKSTACTNIPADSGAVC